MKYFWLGGTIAFALVFMVVLHFENWCLVGIYGSDVILWALCFLKANTGGR